MKGAVVQEDNQFLLCWTDAKGKAKKMPIPRGGPMGVTEESLAALVAAGEVEFELAEGRLALVRGGTVELRAAAAARPSLAPARPPQRRDPARGPARPSGPSPTRSGTGRSIGVLREIRQEGRADVTFVFEPGGAAASIRFRTGDTRIAAPLAVPRGARISWETGGPRGVRDVRWDDAPSPGEYPFHFVPFPDRPASTPYSPEHARPPVDEGRRTGWIDVTIEVLTPLCVSHPPRSDTLLPEEDKGGIEEVLARWIECFEDESVEDARQRVRPFFRFAPDRLAIPGATLRGMIRAVHEAATASRLPGIDDRTGQAESYRFDFDHKVGRWTRTCSASETPAALASYMAWTATDGFSPTERLFGTAADPTAASFAGRVRVGFARAIDARAHRDFIQVRPLTFPKVPLKSEAIYLHPRPDGQSGRYADRAARLRGRKFYWHQWFDGDRGEFEMDRFVAHVAAHAADHRKSVSWLKPVLPGGRFRFRVDFERLDDDELGSLVFALELWGDGWGHKLGRARPLGFGSVVLRIERAWLLPATWYADPGATAAGDDRIIDVVREAARKWLGRHEREPWIEALKQVSRLRPPGAPPTRDYWKHYDDYRRPLPPLR